MAETKGTSTSTSSSDASLSFLEEMGFQRRAAQKALQTSNGDVSAAVDILSPAGGDQMQQCAICVEDVLLSEVAMRCHGTHGQRHYFHAKCLSEWVQKCENSPDGATCPVCRGGVQLRERCLRAFLSSTGDKLPENKLAAYKKVADAARREDVDEDGWTDVEKDLLTAGLIAGGIAIAAALVMALVGSSPKRRSTR